VLALAPLCGGCNTPRTAIEGSDEPVYFPGLRITFSPARGGPADADGTPGAGRRPFLALDVELSRAEADFDQSLAAGETIELDGVLFTGPATVAFDVELVRAALQIRGGLRDERLYLGVSVGLACLDLDLEGRSGGSSSDADEPSPALAFGLELGWRALDRLRLYARAGTDAVLGNVGTLDQLELGAEARLARAVALAAGWREWELEVDDYSESDLDIGLSGPVLTLRFSP
jgi:hypothetical protein